MATTSTNVTAAEIMDRSAVLMNDPAKTDYTYTVLLPFLRMALDELGEHMGDSQGGPLSSTSVPVRIDPGMGAIVSVDRIIPPTTPNYPANLVEIQMLGERPFGSNGPFVPVPRVDFQLNIPPADRLLWWVWENQVIMFNQVTTSREVQLKYLADFSEFTVTPDLVVGVMSSRSYLAYKTAAFAAMFIGENPERAAVLDAKAEQSLERIESITNKGRQQIMTRHRPFRAGWKARGGY